MKNIPRFSLLNGVPGELERRHSIRRICWSELEVRRRGTSALGLFSAHMVLIGRNTYRLRPSPAPSVSAYNGVLRVGYKTVEFCPVLYTDIAYPPGTVDEHPAVGLERVDEESIGETCAHHSTGGYEKEDIARSRDKGVLRGRHADQEEPDQD
jgi:hypothetical protein